MQEVVVCINFHLKQSPYKVLKWGVVAFDLTGLLNVQCYNLNTAKFSSKGSAH